LSHHLLTFPTIIVGFLLQIRFNYPVNVITWFSHSWYMISLHLMWGIPINIVDFFLQIRFNFPVNLITWFPHSWYMISGFMYNSLHLKIGLLHNFRLPFFQNFCIPLNFRLQLYIRIHLKICLQLNFCLQQNLCLQIYIPKPNLT
jgi:hypothetical protein